ncbi:MAG: tRNA (adenosine(37)-N6)-threonylcarbamoyltransferase complex dimerization subunit type 1 TsaB [Deltaproteobacteria bacterium]
MILAIETATPRGSVALVSGGAALGEAALPPGRRASEGYVPAVMDLLAATGASAGDVSCVAVSAGPGAFTGLRVGMSAAKGFCFGWGVPLVPVSTLLALAARFPGEGRVVCPVLDARKHEVYAAFFRWRGGEPERLSPDMAVAPALLPGKAPGGCILFCGDGVGPYGMRIREALGERASFVEGDEGLPRASAVGILGERSFLAGATVDPRTAVPFYLRPSEAERLLRRP